MSRIFHPLLLLIASKVDRELAKHVQYLKVENQILRARIPKQIHTTKDERARLLKFGKPLGKDIDRLITIVTPGTFHRWVREEILGRFPRMRRRNRRQLRTLVRIIAETTGFGYTRILGELRKLGIRRICRQTVKNILKEEGIDPRPKKGDGTWDEFLKVHAQTLWACDFFTKKSVTRWGVKDLFVLVFIHIETREVFVSPSTAHPNSTWVSQQAKKLMLKTEHRDIKPTILIRDGDKKFSKRFDSVFTSAGVRVKKLPICSPNLNAVCERFVQTIKHECLNNFLAFGEGHLNYLVSEFVDYYNNERSHSSRDHLPPCCLDPPEQNETIKLDEIVCDERLGGLIKSYRRVA